jgi:hypothetical protein
MWLEAFKNLTGCGSKKLTQNAPLISISVSFARILEEYRDSGRLYVISLPVVMTDKRGAARVY